MVSPNGPLTRDLQIIIISWNRRVKRYVSDRHAISILWAESYAKSATFIKLWPAILFRFQWQIAKNCTEYDLGTGFFSTSPLRWTTRRTYWNYFFYILVKRNHDHEEEEKDKTAILMAKKGKDIFLTLLVSVT